MKKITVIYDNILKFKGGAVVNSANRELIPGGGLDGQIHKHAGKSITQICRQIGYCATGNAVLTPGGNLPVEYIIHAVGPHYSDGTYGEKKDLESTYKSIFQICDRHKISSIAIPSISTGIFNYPKEEAAMIAVQEARLSSVPKIFFYVVDKRNFEIYKKLIKAKS